MASGSSSMNPKRPCSSNCNPEGHGTVPFGGCLAGMTFEEKAELVRNECMAERIALEKEKTGDGKPMTLCNEGPLCDINSYANNSVHAQYGPNNWQRVSMAVDSGAAETVIPYKLVRSYPIRETEASRAGLNYASATGDPIPNL